MRIGVFGGSFNPPHKMHESIASQLIKKGLLDKVIFVPTSNFYPKAGLINDEERLEMLKLMIKDKKEYIVSDYEFGKLTYTYQTLEYFKNEYPNDQIYFICGSDNLEQLDTWREYQKILGDYKLIVIPRKHDMDSLLNKYEEYTPGEKIKHDKYGEGVIISVETSILTIAFAHPHGIVKIMKGHKSIKKIEE